MLRCVGVVTALTLAVGLWATFLGDRLHWLLGWLLLPFYVLLVFPGFLVAWGGVLGDNGTTESVGLLGTAISLVLNAALACVAYHLVARYRRWRCETPSAPPRSD